MGRRGPKTGTPSPMKGLPMLARRTPPRTSIAVLRDLTAIVNARPEGMEAILKRMDVSWTVWMGWKAGRHAPAPGF